MQSTVAYWHPEAGLQVSPVHGLKDLNKMKIETYFLSSQLIGLNWQPAEGMQVSVVQALWSLQVMFVKTHPVFGLQVSVVQALLSVQTVGG